MPRIQRKGGKHLAETYGSDRRQAFESAFKQRIIEADFLQDNSFHLISIYLYGYAVEMILKSASYRFAGYGPGVEIRKEDRIRVANKAKNFGIEAIGPHDLLGWSRLVVASKRHHVPGVDPRFLRKIESFVQKASNHWDTDMRYRATTAKHDQAQIVREATHWLADHYEDIIKK